MLEIKKVVIDPLLEKRYSGREYDSDRPVEPEKLLLLLEAARSAPSCYNDQPWNFVVCNRFKDPLSYSSLLECLIEFNQGWAKNAPILIVSIAGSEFRKNGKQNRWAQYDTGAAACLLCIQATSMGLMAHQMGGFDANKVQSVLHIPQGYTSMAVIAVGYEVTGNQIPQRDRIDFSTNFFNATWGKKY